MVGKSREAVIQEDTVIKGEISNCEYIEVYGYVEGELAASRVLVQDGGKVFGTLRAGDAEVQGVLQGEVFVDRLIKIGSTGNVNGDVQYGQIAMDLGGELSAKLRNVPPEIKGDLELSVKKGKAVRITLVDLNAVDPDDHAKDLKFSVSNARGGFIAHAKAPTTPIDTFTQADLESGSVAFVHDGASTDKAGFDVQVQDAKGASSGTPKSVNVLVQG
ncbi:MAG: cadherin-like domain-containing protein [Dichotomicrobium sp.]